MTMRLLSLRIASCLVLSLALAMIGCGQQAKWGGTVSGTVEYDGKPVPSGAITFQASNGLAKNAEIIDGKYEVASPPLGECTITVLTAPDTPGGAVPKYEPEDMPADGVIKKPGKYVPIPERYGRADQSDLRFTVTKEPQTHNVKMTR